MLKPTAIAVAIAMAATGCATIENGLVNNSGTVGCVVGGAAGAALGGAIAAATGGDMATGAITGAALGCGATLLYQARLKKLQAIADEEGLKMKLREVSSTAPASSAAGAPMETKVVGMEAVVESGEMFASGSALLTADGDRQLRKIAAVVADRQQQAKNTGQAPAEIKKVLVVGHTDATGSAEFNQTLSEQRAKSVGTILAAAGIPASNIYYQGAGAARPLASNANALGRAQNRRVELVEVNSQELLVERVRDERNSTKYLEHGTAPARIVAKAPAAPSAPKKSPVQSTAPADVATAPATTTAPTPTSSVTKPVPPADTSIPMEAKGSIDFGGDKVISTESDLAQGIAPKHSSFSLISTANASAPVSSCMGDMPRTEGAVINLASGKALEGIETTDYLPGMDGRPWSAKINGHGALIGPVSILREDSAVARQPFLQFIPGLAAGNGKQTGKFQAMANTYDGEDQVLYRVFAVDQKKSPVSCMDIVFDKRSGTAVAAEVFYPKQNQAYVAKFVPTRR